MLNSYVKIVDGDNNNLGMLGYFDFLPSDFNPLLKGFIYIMILLHILALVIWCVLACPSILSRR